VTACVCNLRTLNAADLCAKLVRRDSGKLLASFASIESGLLLGYHLATWGKANGNSSAVQYPAAPQIAASLAPVDRGERITALDTLRGFALLGILLMNIVAMGMYGSAYDDPRSPALHWREPVGLGRAHVVAEGKMRCLFSIVFGASVVLLTSRLESRGPSADVYYRRTFG